MVQVNAASRPETRVEPANEERFFIFYFNSEHQVMQEARVIRSFVPNRVGTLRLIDVTNMKAECSYKFRTLRAAGGVGKGIQRFFLIT